MELVNATKMQAGYTLGVEPSGREHIVVAVKGTFAFPDKGEEPTFAEEQVPLVEADTFTGEPGLSAPIYEADYALRKPRCDVLLNGSAHAPSGKPAERVQVGLKVGSMTKVFNVVGDRVWKASGLRITASQPEPFTQMPITYDRAYGGTDDVHPDEKKHSAYMPNPVGRGYHKQLATKLVDGTPLPNTEEVKRPVTAPDKPYKPMSFGPVGRGWEPRYKLAGTYDDKWLDEVFPFLPADFNDAYYQAAPVDQQIDTPKGGEMVALLNLTPEGRTSFRLPSMEVPLTFISASNDLTEVRPTLDTINLEPDERRIALTWRASMPLRRNIFEMDQVIVGEMSRAWWRAWEVGKDYYPSLGEMVYAEIQSAKEVAE